VEDDLDDNIVWDPEIDMDKEKAEALKVLG
jgi:hypothetical protein